MYLQNVDATFVVRPPDQDDAVEAAGADQRRVQHIPPVGGRHHDHARLTWREGLAGQVQLQVLHYQLSLLHSRRPGRLLLRKTSQLGCSLGVHRSKARRPDPP